MEAEIKSAIIVFGGAICASVIALSGVIIGLASTYLIQMLQRKWSLDDQRREWRKQKWEEALNALGEVEKLVVQAYLGMELTENYWIRFDDAISDFSVKGEPFDDNEIGELMYQYAKKVYDFRVEAKGFDLDRIIQANLARDIHVEGVKYQDRINTLIEKTYK